MESRKMNWKQKKWKRKERRKNQRETECSTIPRKLSVSLALHAFPLHHLLSPHSLHHSAHLNQPPNLIYFHLNSSPTLLSSNHPLSTLSSQLSRSSHLPFLILPIFHHQQTPLISLRFQRRRPLEKSRHQST